MGDVQLLSVAFSSFGWKLNQVAELGIEALCDAMVPDDGQRRMEDPKSQDRAAVPSEAVK